jgi:hypothetical protein
VGGREPTPVMHLYGLQDGEKDDKTSNRSRGGDSGGHLRCHPSRHFKTPFRPSAEALFR